jgi:hypothetical protein
VGRGHLCLALSLTVAAVGIGGIGSIGFEPAHPMTPIRVGCSAIPEGGHRIALDGILLALPQETDPPGDDAGESPRPWWSAPRCSPKL